MPGRATATVVFYIIGTGEKAYILIGGVDVIPQLVTAVGAVQQIRKDALFAILRFRRTALCPLDDLLLYLLKGVPVDNRLMNILEDDPVFFRVIDAGLILEGFGVGLEIDHIAAVFLLGQDFTNGAVFPSVRVWLRLFAAPADAFFLLVRRAVENPIFL